MCDNPGAVKTQPKGHGAVWLSLLRQASLQRRAIKKDFEEQGSKQGHLQLLCNVMF